MGQVSIKNDITRVKLNDDVVAKSQLCGFVSDLIVKDSVIARNSKSIELLDYYSSELRVKHTFVAIQLKQGDVIIVDPLGNNSMLIAVAQHPTYFFLQ